MILYFYLNLGTAYLNTSGIWDEHLLEKYLPVESCQRWLYKTKLPLRNTGLASLQQLQLVCYHNQTVGPRISDPARSRSRIWGGILSSGVILPGQAFFWGRHGKISIICCYYRIKDL